MVIYSGGGDKMKRVAEYKDWVNKSRRIYIIEKVSEMMMS